MQARLSAFLVWALVAAGVAFWALRLMVRPTALPAHVQTVDTRVVAGGDFVRMFGAAPVAESAAPAPIAESSRFKLLGVLAPVAHEGSPARSRSGVALIAVDGKTAKPYAVGASLDDTLILQAVSRRSASIGPAGGAASVVLELPPPAAPATGTLPVATAEAVPARQPQMTAPQQAAQDPDDPAVPMPPQRGDAQRNPAVR